MFALQHIRYEASLHPEIDEVIVTDATFNPAKQVADIEDLITKDVDLILYWPVDEQAIQGALKKAVEQGIATVNTGGGFSAGPGTVANAYINQWNIGELVARQLFEDLGGKGKIFAMLPIAGTTAAVDQLAALESRAEGVSGHRAALRRVRRLESRQGQADHREPAAALPARSTASSRPPARCRSASPRRSRRRGGWKRS